MATSKVFNPKTLLHYTEQDRDLAVQLLHMARVDMPDFLEKAEKLCVEQRYAEASRAIHSLKGVAGTLGAEQLYENSFRCEILLKEAGVPEENGCGLEDLRRDMECLFTDTDFLRFTDDRPL